MSGRPRLRWLHLGQLAVGIDGPPPAFEALLRAFGPGGALADRRPDLILLTGDLARTGAEAEYVEVATALRALSRVTQVPLGRIVCVPGNHDVDRSRVSRRFSLEVPDAAATAEFFGEREDVAVALRRFKPFLQFHQQLFNDLPDADRPFVARRLSVAGVSVGLVGVNSAWLAHEDGAAGRLVVGRAPLAAAAAEVSAEGPPDLVLGLVHHPPALWADFEQIDVQPRFEATCDLMLHGAAAHGPGGRWLGAPAVSQGAVWGDLHGDAVRWSPLTLGPRGWQVGPETRVPLPRALPSLQAAPPSSAQASRRPPDVEGYLRHVEDEWGYVLLTGLLKDRAQAAVSVRSIYVSLHSQHPLVDGPLAHGPVEALRRRLLTTPDDAGLDGETLAALRAALAAVGVPAHAISDRGALHAWQRLRAQPERDFDAVVHGLQTLDLELAIARGRKVLVQGDPGTGKSTTLQHVAVALVDAWRGKPEVAESLGFEHPFPLPILVPMRRFWTWLTLRSERFMAGGAGLLLDYLRATLAHHAGGDGWIEPALKAGQVAVLLDGLDEVPVALDRERAARCVRDFVRQYEGCWYGVTSRPAGLGPAERLALERAGLTTVRVQPLEPPQIERFVQAWYAALIPDGREARRKARDLLDRIADNPLTRTPITLIAIAIVHHTLGDLPQRRAELYEHCVQALCGRWDDGKEEAGALLAGGLPRGLKVQLLQRLAHEIHQAGEGGQTLERGPALARVREVLTGADAASDEAAHDLVDRLGARSGLLVPDGQRGWRFRHLTFQEYLTARYLCAEREDAAAELARRLHDPRWREVVLLAVGYRAKDSAVQGRRLVGLLCAAADQRRAPADRARAFGVVAQALLDLAAYRVGQLDSLMAQLAPHCVALLADPSQPGDVDARVWMGEALGLLGDPRLGWADDTHLILVPDGDYTTGDPGGAHEAPLRAWHVPTFRVARYPVTRGQYAAFIDAGGYADRTLWAAGGPPSRGLGQYRAQLAEHPNHPVTEVDWFEACAFCAWLNRQQPRRDGLVWRLPTTAEWEKAARGGHALADGRRNPAPTRRYPWGDAWRADAANWWKVRARDETTPVGCFPAGAGPYGALDQAGNVDEWCLDPDPDTGGRALRGGYFLGAAVVLQVWWHSSEEPDWHSDGVGFRVVAGAPVDLDDPSGLSEPSVLADD